MIYDFCIVGGGIVGLATAMQVLDMRRGASLVLLEKETALARHQTGHNSGVIHTGIYYEPGSWKARLCREGSQAIYEFCAEHAIRTERCGKLIVATDAVEVERLKTLHERAARNDVNLSWIGQAELLGLEPRIRGKVALLSPDTGIVDYREVALEMANVIRRQGAEIVLGQRVDRIGETTDSVEIGAQQRTWHARKLIVCGGLQADRLARIAGLPVDFCIAPFRGEYYRLPAAKHNIVQHLIYPAPDPSLPFLGVHITRMMNGNVTVGPNAVIGLSREGYSRLMVRAADIWSYASFAGFWRLIWRYRAHTWRELRSSLLRSSYLEECRRYCPELELSDLIPHPAGIRAQLVTKDGQPAQDFVFRKTLRTMHIYNAPSPAATAAIPIGKMIAEAIIGEGS